MSALTPRPVRDQAPLEIIPVSLPNGLRLVRLIGEADASNFRELAEGLFSQLPGGVTKLVVDAAGLAYLDSMALRALLQAARVLRSRQGGLVLLQPAPCVRKLLRLTGADTLMAVLG